MSTLAWPILLLAFGLILLIAEVFIPSGGLLGVLAFGCVALSLWQAFRHSTNVGLNFLLADFLILPVVVMVALYLWPKTPFARRAFLKPPAPEEIEGAHTTLRLDVVLGQFGRTLTPLRPSGFVEIDGQRLHAISEDGLVPTGALVRAVRVHSGQIVVRAIAEAPLQESARPDLDPYKLT
ncbi:MAG: NfeD family protein [Isosphaeraceae bacterium]|nr:NfeD family protein [Isosphaeraceae bacterium]